MGRRSKAVKRLYRGRPLTDKRSMKAWARQDHHGKHHKLVMRWHQDKTGWIPF